MWQEEVASGMCSRWCLTLEIVELRKHYRVSAAALMLALCPTQNYAEPLDIFRDCDVCPEMVELPLGEFMMGAPDDEFRFRIPLTEEFSTGNPENPFKKEDEGPQHKVMIDLPIAMGRNEVTYDEWMACVQDGGCNGYVPRSEIYASGPARNIVKVDGDHPVLYISFEDALAYVSWINRKLGVNSYRLPTEAEWEYAARAGTQTLFAQGNSLTTEQVNFSKEASEFAQLKDLPDLVERGYPVPVGELDAANDWGIRHMSGNAGELTMSCYTERYAGWGLSSQWFLESQRACSQIVDRGGSYAGPSDAARVAWRGYSDKESRTKYVGFRIAKEMR
jgi:formylglycine-generating enzyme required for sulfatase activity